jgi:hypothetical protein
MSEYPKVDTSEAREDRTMPEMGLPEECYLIPATAHPNHRTLPNTFTSGNDGGLASFVNEQGIRFIFGKGGVLLDLQLPNSPLSEGESILLEMFS